MVTLSVAFMLAISKTEAPLPRALVDDTTQERRLHDTVVLSILTALAGRRSPMGWIRRTWIQRMARLTDE